MAVSTGDSGDWRTAVSSTLSEVRSQLNTDDVKWDDLVGFEHDGTQFVAVYYRG